MPTCSTSWDSHRARWCFSLVIPSCFFRRWWAERLVLWRRMCPRIHCPQPPSQVGSWPPIWSGADWLRTGKALRFHIPFALATSSERWAPQGMTCDCELLMLMMSRFYSQVLQHKLILVICFCKNLAKNRCTSTVEDTKILVIPLISCLFFKMGFLMWIKWHIYFMWIEKQRQKY